MWHSGNASHGIMAEGLFVPSVQFDFLCRQKFEWCIFRNKAIFNQPCVNFVVLVTQGHGKVSQDCGSDRTTKVCNGVYAAKWSMVDDLALVKTDFVHTLSTQTVV